MSQQANCPSCGGPITFKVSTSLVAVCPHCKSVVGRGDRGLETLGKVADLVETNSPLDVGVKGRFGGLPFELVGRTQFQHPAGGVWDEWYAAFGDGHWGWLAEAMGRFFLTYQTATPPGLPSYDRLTLGQRVEIDDHTLVVAEKNRAKTASAIGEVPYRVIPGKDHPFADLSGPHGAFGTIDYSDATPTVYLGREVTLDELAIPKAQRRRYPGQEPKIAAVRLNCPNCGGALDLRAPDKSERVGCPYCGSLLDVQEGQLKLLKSLVKPNVEPVIPLGAVGSRDGVEWTCLGFLQRFVTFEGTNYFWEEYLLYQPRLGFRWLTRSDDHWNWVEPLPPGSVQGVGKFVSYADRTYTLFQAATARVAIVYGEFYWKVQAGEEVESRDYVSAPYQLSLEVTKAGGEGEINWSHAEYVEPEAVRAMFALPHALPSPTTIGPNQPFPHTAVYPLFAALAGGLVVLALLWWLISPNALTFEERFELPPIPKETVDKKQPFERVVEWRGGRNARVTIVPHGTGWVGVRGTLTREVRAPEPGVKGDPGPPVRREFAVWSQPRSQQYVYLGAMPAGRYTMMLDVVRQNVDSPDAATLRIRQGVAHLSPVMIALLVLAAVPFLVAIYQLTWESRRWAESNAT